MTDPSPPPGRGLRWLFRFLFVLLVIHLVVVYTYPQWIIPGARPAYEFNPITASPRRSVSPLLQSTVVDVEGKPHLWGGRDPRDHFNIEVFRLDPKGLRYGLGREKFKALIEPQFDTSTAANAWLTPHERVLAVKIGDEVKVYPIQLLQRHEVVNDTIGGRPIFASYCVLADLAAVYDRRWKEHELTFAVSGYTYGDPGVWQGLQAFVLWDRDTESLWWPPIGQAVSGPLVDQPMKVLEHELWAQTTWGQVRKRHENALVLKPQQTMNPPADWPRIQVAARSHPPTAQHAEAAPKDAIAPHWGENGTLE